MIRSKNVLNIPVLLMILLLSPSMGSQVFAQNHAPEIGIYDGKIGNDQIVLVAERADPTTLKGYFVLNRGKAVEESHTFSLVFSGSQPFFQSDLYVGKLNSENISSSSFDGILTLMNKKKRFFFWRPKEDLKFVLRPEMIVHPTDRYQKEIFSGVEVKSDLLYGKAKGYWTRSPYSDDPYITTLSKGLIKAFDLSLIHISEPTRLGMISYAVFCLKKKKQPNSKRIS